MQEASDGVAPACYDEAARAAAITTDDRDWKGLEGLDEREDIDADEDCFNDRESYIDSEEQKQVMPPAQENLAGKAQLSAAIKS